MNILNELPKNITDLEVVICCGKGLGSNGEVDWFLSSRIDLAVKIAESNPRAVVILSGGIGLTSDITQKQMSEAEAMDDYRKTLYPNLRNKIIKESKSSGSLEQLCLIKEECLLENNYRKLAIVSDEFHIKRIATLFDAVLGDGYEVYYLGSKINLYGKYRQLIEDYENTNYFGAQKIVKLLPRGEHSKFKNFDKAYRDLRKLRMVKGESRLDYISPEEVVKFMNNSGEYSL